MVFGGPRQAEKLRFPAIFALRQRETPSYLNWDSLNVKTYWLANFLQQKLIILTKSYKDWKSLIKGFTILINRIPILITGSARLDYFRKAEIPFRGGIIITGYTL